MIAELRAGFLLFVALAYFLMIIVIFAVSLIMKPDRWSDRERRSAVENRSSVSA